MQLGVGGLRSHQSQATLGVGRFNAAATLPPYQRKRCATLCTDDTCKMDSCLIGAALGTISSDALRDRETIERDVPSRDLQRKEARDSI